VHDRTAKANIWFKVADLLAASQTAKQGSGVLFENGELAGIYTMPQLGLSIRHNGVIIPSYMIYLILDNLVKRGAIPQYCIQDEYSLNFTGSPTLFFNT